MRAAVTLAAVLALLLTAPARAEDLHSSNGFLDYDDTGEPSANNLTVSVDGDDFKFVDSALIAASGDCSSSGLFIARCPAAGVINMWIKLEGEDDQVNAAGIGVPLGVNAGAGSDKAVSGPAADELAGSLGDDEMHGGPGPDLFNDNPGGPGQQGGGADDFYGDGGDDTFIGAGADGTGAGSDLYDGGEEFDTVDYTAHATGSLVNLPAGVSHPVGTDADTLVSIERVLAGDGLDVLIGDGAGNVLAGGGSSDVLFGGDGADRLEGQLGSDRLEGGPGPDVLRGGGDSDVVTYDDAPGPVLVTLDNQPGDGQDGENDDVGSDIERVRATPFADQITGSSAANAVQAGAGADTVEGGEGDDDLHGEAGADHLGGGPGRDTIAGGPGGDEVEAGSGDDTIDVADGETDRVTCGIGIDTVSADPADVLFGDCEVVARAGQNAPAAGPPPAAPPTAIAQAQVVPVVAFEGRRVRVSRTGRGRLGMRCDAAACAGTLVLKWRGRTIARTPYSLAADRRATVRFRLTRTGRRLLRRTGRLRATATAGGISRRYTLVRRPRLES